MLLATCSETCANAERRVAGKLLAGDFHLRPLAPAHDREFEVFDQRAATAKPPNSNEQQTDEGRHSGGRRGRAGRTSRAGTG